MVNCIDFRKRWILPAISATTLLAGGCSIFEIMGAGIVLMQVAHQPP